jgi:hypothetical protein
MRADKTRAWAMCDCSAWYIVLSVECVCMCVFARATGSLTCVRVIV